MLRLLELAEARRLALVAAAGRRESRPFRLASHAGRCRGGGACLCRLRWRLYLRLAAVAVDRRRPAAGPLGSQRRRALSARRGAHHIRPADADAIAGVTHDGAAFPWTPARRRTPGAGGRSPRSKKARGGGK